MPCIRTRTGCIGRAEPEPDPRGEKQPQRANAVALGKANAEQIWIRSLAQRMPFGKVLVAIANKHARQLWAILARDEDYGPEAWLNRPMVQRPASDRRQRVAA